MAVLTSLAVASLLAWIGLALGRGGWWRADQRLDETALPAAAALPDWPAVVAVVPARNEAATIGRSVVSLLGQAYPGRLTVVVVDDGSSDGTAAEAARAGYAAGRPHRLHIVPGRPLAAGWVGKVAAMATGVEAARAIDPAASLLLFTDADIAHDPGNLARLVAKAEREGLDLVSLMVRLQCTTAAERLLIPPFVLFFQKLYPFRRVNDRDDPTVAAAGGCMLVRAAALDAAGGLEAIRDRLIDDCALAALLKPRGPVWLGLSESTESLRGYSGIAGIWGMVARTAFTQLNHSWLALAGTVAAMTVLYVVPPLAALAGLAAGSPAAAAAGLAGWAIISALAVPTFRLYDLGLRWAVLTPLAALLYTAMTVDSARRHAEGRGGAWKGRTYPERPALPRDEQ